MRVKSIKILLEDYKKMWWKKGENMRTNFTKVGIETYVSIDIYINFPYVFVYRWGIHFIFGWQTSLGVFVGVL